MEQVNEEWQQYAEQRDQYVRVLAHRYRELEQLHSKCSVPSSAAFTAEQQQKVDRLLHDQRQKTELAERVRSQVCSVYNERAFDILSLNFFGTSSFTAMSRTIKYFWNRLVASFSVPCEVPFSNVFFHF
jgi:hypothetical protein